MGKRPFQHNNRTSTRDQAINFKQLSWIMLFLTTLGYSVNGWAEDIYTDRYSSGFNYNWVSTESGDQDVRELLPFDPRPNKSGNAFNIIHWYWNKREYENKWSGWGMQWQGWNADINLYTILGLQPTPDFRALTRQQFDQFRASAGDARLKFRVFISKFDENSAEDYSTVRVRFDGKEDKPSKEIAFLNDEYLFNENSLEALPDLNEKNLGLDQNVAYRVEIPLDHFEIIRKRIDPSTIKQIVFSTPNEGSTQGDLLLFDIKIEIEERQ